MINYRLPTKAFAVALVGLLFACTDKTYITNPPPVKPAIDRTPPEVWFVRPAGGSVITDTVRIELAFFDSSGVDSIRLLKDGAPIRIIPAEAGIQHGQISYLWDTTSDSDGVHLWQAIAWDRAGNRGLSETLLLRVKNRTDEPAPDVRPPIVSWVEPAAGDTLSGDVSLRFQIMDDRELTSAEVLLNGGRYAGLALAGAFADTGLVWRTAEYSDGVWMMQVKAFDEAGNLGWSEALLVRVKNQPDPPPPDDRTPPRIRWITPAPGSIVRDTIVLEFSVEDESEIDSVKVIVDGVVDAILAGQEDNIYTVERNTWRWTNGRHIIEIWAWDSAKNAGRSEPIGLTVDNHKVIWVPDNYDTIQSAINASVDGDTVRVRAGTYREQLQFFDKNVSLVSESGPEETILDGTGYYTAAWITGGQDTTMLVRGLTFRNTSDFVCYGLVCDGASPRIVNCIFQGSSGEEQRGLSVEQNNALIRNNLFMNLRNGPEIAHSWGDLSNNIIMNVFNWAVFNRAINGQLLVPDYNLLWNVGRIWVNAGWGEHNLMNVEPAFEEGSYRLRANSRGVDEGRPDLQDPDGTRSDIGVYGGPYAY